jgi:hypothetical protein
VGNRCGAIRQWRGVIHRSNQHYLAESRLVRYGEKKGKMPYEEFRKLFEQRPEPSRWQRIILGTIKWALAGGLCVIAVLLMR